MKSSMMRRRRQVEHQSRVVDDLSSLSLELLRLPPITAGGLASLLLGISMALIFCGSLTLFIGFMLIPWVFGLFILLYFVLLARSVLYYAAKLSSSSPPPNPKDMGIPAWKQLL